MMHHDAVRLTTTRRGEDRAHRKAGPKPSTRRSTALFIILGTLTCALVGVEALTKRRAARAFEEAIAMDGDDINYCTCAGTEASLARSGCCSGSWASQEQCYWFSGRRPRAATRRAADRESRRYCGCVCTGGSDDWYPDQPSPAPSTPPTTATDAPTAAPTVAAPTATPAHASDEDAAAAAGAPPAGPARR